VRVTEKTDTVNAKNGNVYTIYYFNEGNIPDITVTRCNAPAWNGITWSATSEVVRNGALHGLTKVNSGVINGVVARGNWDELWVSGETQRTGSGIKWNALPEATSARSPVSIKTHIESTSTHKVNVKRIVIGKYGAVEYEIRFVLNANQYPSGTGDVNDLVVRQDVATDGNLYPPVRYEEKKGSIGITGSFLIDLHDINGPRKVAFDESALRLRRKLEEMFTIGKVYVERSNYPSSTTGGWGANPVADGTFGGYEWRFYFVRNTGNYNGWTFPAGSGNLDPLTVTYNPGVDIFGTNIKVQSVPIMDGSVPIDGQFTLAYNGSTTDPLNFNQQPFEAEAMIESLKNIGDVDVSQRNRAMQKLDGVWASVNRDAMTLDITYDSDKPNADVRQMLADGDLIRVGGVPSVDASGAVSIDGATVYSIATVQSGSPVITPVDTVPLAVPGETLRLGADNYTVVRNGAEVQVVSITCTDGSSACGKFRLKFTHKVSGTDYYSTCIKRAVNQDMTSAIDLQASFSSMNPVFAGDVIVTRTASFDFRSFVYSIYFEGPSVSGDVNELTISTTTTTPVDCSGGLVPGTYATVFTAIQGGNTEVQDVRVNVDAGYVDGDLFKLRGSVGSNAAQDTPMLKFGATAAEVETEFNKLPAYAYQVLPFTVGLRNINNNGRVKFVTFVASSSIYGIIQVGEKVSITTTATTYQAYTVSRIVNGLEFLVEETVQESFQANTFYTIRKVHTAPVRVARYGTGNSTAHVAVVTVTADEPVSIDGLRDGFYKIRLSLNGVSAVTSSCIRYHSSALEFQNAIMSLPLDFNGDGAYNGVDDDYAHVSVKRSGDGSAASGYGYAYTIRFGGPDLLKDGQTGVMGASKPTIEVIAEGSVGGCYDPISTTDATVMVNISKSSGKRTWEVAYSNTNTNPDRFKVRVTSASFIQPGDRIRVPTSATPYKLYTVLSASPYFFTVDGEFPLSVAPVRDTVAQVLVVRGPFPEFSVDHVIQGEDSYIYKVFFVGSHIVSAPALTATLSNTITQYNGMRRGVQVRTDVDSGSQQTLKILLASTNPIYYDMSLVHVDDKYWKIVTNGNVITPAYQWGEPEANIRTDLSSHALFNGYTVAVTRTGTGGNNEQFGYQYAVAARHATTNQVHKMSDISVLTDGQVSAPTYVYANSTFYERSKNDLVISGTYTGTYDVTFTIKITKVNAKWRNVTADMFQWKVTTYTPTPTTTAFGNERNVTLGVPMLLKDGVYVTFGHRLGSTLNDQWVFSAVRMQNKTLPSGATITSRIESSGLEQTRKVTLNRGLVSSHVGGLVAYRVPPLFAVQDQTVEVYKITTKNTIGAASLSFRLSVNRTLFGYFDNTTLDSQPQGDRCVDWNAEDFEVEAMLRASQAGLCNNQNDCVSVTRSVDRVNNPNGYIYSIYFEKAKFGLNLDDSYILLNFSSCEDFSVTSLADHQAMIQMASVQHGSMQRRLKKTSIPLATSAVSFAEASFRGPSVSRQPIYKVNGNTWAVTFNSNIGELPPLVATPTKHLSAGASVSTVGDVVKGVNPNSLTINNLHTGVLYNSRVKAYTRGANRGYSAVSNTASATPSGSPGSLANFIVGEVQAVNEVQTITVGATHIREVQTITTRATRYAEVQEIIMTAPEGQDVKQHNFTIRFPDVHIIQVKADDVSKLSNGKFKLSYSYYDNTNNLMVRPTGCLNVNADASVIESALNGLTGVGANQIKVTRSGYGGYSDFFGYVYEVSFSGNMVAGDNALLTLTYGNDVNCGNSAPDGLTYTVNKKANNIAVGLDTPIQRLELTAQQSIDQGQFTITYSGQTTASCIPWNATAAELKASLESLNNIDTVLVERFGNGDLTSNNGYVWSVYFIGNQFMRTVIGNPSAIIPSLVVNGINSATGSCDRYAYFVNGVKTNFNAAGTKTFTIGQNVVRPGGLGTVNSDLSMGLWSTGPILN